MNDEPQHILLTADAHTLKRRRDERIAKGILLGAASVSVLILALLIIRLIVDGIGAFSPSFFLSVYTPSGVKSGAAGILDALIASVIILIITMLFAIPLGLGGAIYINEYAKDNWFRRSVENWIANLAAVPSVVYGLLGLAVFVRFMQMGANMLAAGLTLALLILPILIVSSQEALKSVPMSLREASYGMGATTWQTVRHHVLPSAMPGILTGNILAMSRAAGETAPVLIIGLPTYMTLLRFAPTDPGTPLQLRIYYLAQLPGAQATQMAAGAIIVLVVATLLLNLAAIILRSRLSKRTQW